MGRSSNLVIMLTDIAGFTKATSTQSRKANERLLATHNRIMLGLLKRFGGTLIKMIGDALLATFSSPTDAVLCGMAMQDALYEFNQSAPTSEQIHVRIVLHEGEVRFDGKDIFGSPVNEASRIEKIVPPDQIYFTQPVYMTMNKVEIPAELAGTQHFDGVADPMTLYRVPLYASTSIIRDDGKGVVKRVAYPFGGAHLSNPYSPQRRMGLRIQVALLICALLVAGLGAFLLHARMPQSNRGHAVITTTDQTRDGRWSRADTASLRLPLPTAPTKISDLALWLEPEKAEDGAGVSFWPASAGGESIKVTQSDATRRPMRRSLGERLWIEFDGQGDYFEVNGLSDRVASAAGLTVAFVAGVRGDSTQYFLSGSPEDRADSIFRIGTNAGRARLKFSSSRSWIFEDQDSSTKLISFGVPAIYVANFSVDGHATLFLNGTPVIQSVVTDHARISDLKRISIGQEWDREVPSDFFNGLLGDLVVYSRLISDDERRGLESYLAHRYLD